MATMSRAQRHESSETHGSANGHSAGEGRSTPLEDAVRTARSLPSRAREKMRDSPYATLAAVAGGSFLLGTLLGSRVVRAMLLAVGPYVAVQLIGGEVGEKARRYAADLV